MSKTGQAGKALTKMQAMDRLGMMPTVSWRRTTVLSWLLTPAPAAPTALSERAEVAKGVATLLLLVSLLTLVAKQEEERVQRIVLSFAMGFATDQVFLYGPRALVWRQTLLPGSLDPGGKRSGGAVPSWIE